MFRCYAMWRRVGIKFCLDRSLINRQLFFIIDNYTLEIRLLPHHNNVQTTTVVVVVVHHSILKNDHTCTVSVHLNVLFKFLNFSGLSRHLNSTCGCGKKGNVWVWTTTTLKCCIVVCSNSLIPFCLM